MTQPVRLTLSRAPGFDLQALSRATNGLPAVSVARPGKWGNPFRVGGSISMRYPDGDRLSMGPPIRNAGEAVAWHEAMWRAMDARKPRFLVQWMQPLRGKNLACWCKQGPCHADVLLEIANRPICEALPPAPARRTNFRQKIAQP